MRAFILLLLLTLSLLSLCTVKRTTRLTIDNQIFVLSVPLEVASKFPASNESEIKKLIDESDRVCIDFVNTSSKDNAYFAVVAFNLVYKLTRYYNFVLNQSKNFTACKQEPRIFLIGPNTGAAKNELRLENQTIVLEATSYEKLKAGGEKLFLIVAGFRDY